jgi:hypothetical protein
LEVSFELSIRLKIAAQPLGCFANCRWIGRRFRRPKLEQCRRHELGDVPNQTAWKLYGNGLVSDLLSKRASVGLLNGRLD